MIDLHEVLNIAGFAAYFFIGWILGRYILREVYEKRILELMKENEILSVNREFYNKVARLYHYPECWDTAAYPTLYDAIYELRGQCTTCGMYLPAEEPVPSCETCYIQDYWPDGTRPSQCDECEEADARVNWRPAELPPKEEVLDEPKVAPAEDPDKEVEP